jgi:diaminopimelate epimerase
MSNSSIVHPPTNLSFHYVKCSPSGNITTLVLTPIQRKYHAEIARQIMQVQHDVEQVGFIESPTCPGAVARLQMMGGEFCGNATCSLGWMLSMKNAFRQGFIEVSGEEKPVFIKIVDDKVEMEISTPYRMSFAGKSKDWTIIKLQGITHVIVTSPPLVNLSVEAGKILDDLGLFNEEAAGVLFTAPYKEGFSIKPVVWVRDTGSLVEESACASGSLGLAIWQSIGRKSEVVNLPVYQPGGDVICVSAHIIDESSARIIMSGRVKILEESELTVEVQG